MRERHARCDALPSQLTFRKDLAVETTMLTVWRWNLLKIFVANARR